MSRVVVTADDFGLCAETNAAICTLHDCGVVGRTSLLVNTDWFQPSIEALRRRPDLDVAVHLNLTDGAPVLPPREVPTLVDARGRFRGGRHYGVLARIISHRIERTDIHREWRAQIAKAVGEGLVVRQLNSHGHLHLLPQLHGIVLDLLREFDIADVRLVRAHDSIRGVLLYGCSVALSRRLRRNGFNVVFPRRTLGLRNPGGVDRRLRLGEFARADAAATELIVHPSKGANEYHARWRYDGDAVLEYLLRQAPSVSRPDAAGSSTS